METIMRKDLRHRCRTLLISGVVIWAWTAMAPHSRMQEIEPAAEPAQTFTVTSTNDSGAGTLRQAITDANASPGSDTIVFNIAGSGIKSIFITSMLPTITDPVVIDGTTQPA